MNQGTYFAPGERDPNSIVDEEAAIFSDAHVGQSVLDAIPDLALVLNDKRQIVAANTHCLKALGLTSVDPILGKRPGEAINCIHVVDGPEGCGTSLACRQCGAARAILNCLSKKQTVQQECRITAHGVDGDASMEFLAKATFVKVGSYPLVLLVLRDISGENRKEALERLFFHDVMNTVGGIIGLSDLMVSDVPQESAGYAKIIHHLAENVADEIASFRNLLQAENGTLRVDVIAVPIQDLFLEIFESLSHHPVCKGRTIQIDVQPGLSLRTDPMLLRRVVVNLTKNALEASPRGSVVKLSAVRNETGVTINVNNPGLIPPSVQSQLFKRSFSTKGEAGRGLGTYSIKLFTERYLKGKVDFSSSEHEGTTFTVVLPSCC